MFKLNKHYMLHPKFFIDLKMKKEIQLSLWGYQFNNSPNNNSLFPNSYNNNLNNSLNNNNSLNYMPNMFNYLNSNHKAKDRFNRYLKAGELIFHNNLKDILKHKT